MWGYVRFMSGDFGDVAKISGFTEGVCNKGGFKMQGSMKTTEEESLEWRPHLGNLETNVPTKQPSDII